MNWWKPFRILVPALCLSALAVAPAYGQYSPLRPFTGKIGKTLEETEQAWPERVKAPAGAPNVVWVLLDDVGFGASSAFGGLVQTPAFDALAAGGLRYNNFHTTGICSPTRAALLTGRNHHSVGMGHHAELGIGTPGYNGDIPFEAGTIAEIFKENGYNTFALGKWHGNAPKDLTVAGPYNRWPTGRGFEHFYGFLGGATDQWHPQLVEETNPIDIEPNTKHLNELLADKAISYIANQKSADPDKPFFLYLAPGATHAPHHVAKEWSDKYKGKFDGGWEQYREDVFKRQQALGLVPKGTQLPPLQNGLKPWNALSADEKKVFARFMEVYAGFLSYTDYQVGRVFDYLRQIGQFDNTLVFVIIGDNGGSKEGSYTGNDGNGEQVQGQDIAHLLKNYDKIGTEYTSPNYPLGWSQAMNTPFRYWKSDVNSEGATHNPLIVSYGSTIKDRGTLRSQYHHVTDVLPTTIELTGITVPQQINGYPQLPIHGTSFAYSIADPKAPTRHNQQYFELHGGRAIYKDGWKAEVYHPRNIFGESGIRDVHFTADFSKDKWELYHLDEDWTETTDLAAQNPQKLEELKALFDSEAKKYNVYPLKNYRAGVPAPVLVPKRTIYAGTTIPTKVVIGKGPVTITAEVEIKDRKAGGVVFANGGLGGGSSLYVKDGKLHYSLNSGEEETTLSAAVHLAPGKHSLRVEYGASGTVGLFADNRKLVEKGIKERNRYLGSAASQGISVGRDLNSPVTKAYAGTFPFTGLVNTVVIDQ
ncbi:arylsulfatase [Paraflavisolibacter sp. H34]|uniref:arylsulfatase n=1 Tax=Huijunlia imazamoxiresistens TaxID=3127457 RepID=UPI003017FC46